MQPSATQVYLIQWQVSMCVHTTEAFRSLLPQRHQIYRCVMIVNYLTISQTSNFKVEGTNYQLVLKALQCHLVTEENITFI